MKKLFSLLVATAIVSTSCTKDILNPNIPGNGTEAIHHGGGTEDNHNGGGHDDNNNGGGNDDNNNGGGDDNVSSVPDAVLSVFNARYTDAANIEWKLLSNGNYKAEFFRGSVKWQTTFTPSGTIVKEEHD